MKLSTRRAPIAARLAALIAAGLALGATQQALAAGTASGTSIDNTATLSYQVGGVSQTPVDSNTESFAVDNKINLTVARTDVAAVAVAPGQVAATPLPNPPAYLTFSVTNTGNTTQDFLLSNTNPASGATNPFGGTSEFAVSSCRTFIETAGGAGLQIGTDLEATYLDDVAADGSRTVYLVCDTPLTATNSQDAVAGLIAQAVDAAGSVGSPSTPYSNAQLTAANTQGGVEIVAADGTGTETGDIDRDTQHSDRSAYVIQSATLSVTKAMASLCDPFNGTAANSKNIPGAMVTWTITVSNSGSASATLAQITDALNGNTTFDPNLVLPTDAATCSSTGGTPESGAGRGFRITSSAGARPLGGTAGYLTGAADGDGGTISGQNVTIDFGLALPAGGAYTAGELKAGESTTVRFNVTIN
jgi:uncharacterized repeat protein (TIGR01451 family)